MSKLLEDLNVANFGYEKLIKRYIDGMYTEYYSNTSYQFTMVFLHDSLGCVDLWRDFPLNLGKKLACNVLIYDRIGYGKSFKMETIDRSNDYMHLEAEKLMSIIEYFQLNQVFLFGHSDGGSISLIAGSFLKPNIRGIIVEAPHVFVEEITLNGIRKAEEDFYTTN